MSLLFSFHAIQTNEYHHFMKLPDISSFFKVFGRHMSFGATGTPVLDFSWCLLWVSKPEWVLTYLHCRGKRNLHPPRSTTGATCANLLAAGITASAVHCSQQKWGCRDLNSCSQIICASDTLPTELNWDRYYRLDPVNSNTVNSKLWLNSKF